MTGQCIIGNKVESFEC